MPTKPSPLSARRFGIAFPALLALSAFASALAPLPVRAAPRPVEGGEPAPPPSSAAPGASFSALWSRATPLITLRQVPGQSERDFLLEVAATIDALTDRLASEVCGVFEHEGHPMRLVITLMTQGSPAFCLHPKPMATCPRGGLLGASIHSHVDARSRRGAAPCGARPMGDRFSAMDYAAGPGYLVHRGRLWHQRGVGTQRFVARLDAVSTLDAARLAASATIVRTRTCA